MTHIAVGRSRLVLKAKVLSTLFQNPDYIVLGDNNRLVKLDASLLIIQHAKTRFRLRTITVELSLLVAWHRK